MNTNNVVSAPGATNLTGKEFQLVKLTANGIDIAASGDTVIGTLRRAMPYQEDGNYQGKAVAVQLRPGSIHSCMIGASSAVVAKGATLAVDAANPGRLIPSASSPIALAWESFTAANGAIVRVIFT